MYEKYIKRTFDFFIAVFLVILFFIPMAIIALAIKLEDGGSILFRQERIGKNGKVFHLYKFRSMKEENDVLNFNEDDLVTKVGHFIRKTSLDEIPQIFNIIKGEMSFIGPRPWIPEYHLNMTKKQQRRANVLPGITGLAQVHGRNGIDIFKKIRYDLEYVDNISFKYDMKIVFLTIKTVLSSADYECGKRGIKEELDALRTQK